jgi:DNA-directed RNA polymerase subunit RPC12/RpoP
MSIRFRCPNCNKTFKLKTKYAGRKAACPCGTRLVVPSQTEGSTIAEVVTDPCAQESVISPLSAQKHIESYIQSKVLDIALGTDVALPDPAPSIQEPDQTEAMKFIDLSLADTKLRPKARAFLLVRLCQMYQADSPEKANIYWNKLKAFKKSDIPDELNADIAELRDAMQQPPAVKGFAAERMAEIETAMQYTESEPDKAGRYLRACELSLKERRWPFGKDRIWLALIHVWTKTDRKQALKLCVKLNKLQRLQTVHQMNQKAPLTPDEWLVLEDAIGTSDVVNLVLAILEDPWEQIDLPDRLVPEIGRSIGKPLSSMTKDNVQETVSVCLKRLQRLVSIQQHPDRLSIIYLILKETFHSVASSHNFGSAWAYRFTTTAQIISLGVKYGILNEANSYHFLEKTPKHLIDFASAHYAAMTADPKRADKALRAVRTSATQKENSTGWFLVALVERGLSETALKLAEEQAIRHIARVRRALLCKDPAAAGKSMSTTDLSNDLIGSFLLRSPGPDRIAYIRDITENGTKVLPYELWFREIVTTKESLEKSIQIYPRDLSKSRQFTEYVRISGYGGYEFERRRIEGALLETLNAWKEQQPDEVRSLLNAMWYVICPKLEQMDYAVFLLALRFASHPQLGHILYEAVGSNAITYCLKLFAIEPEFLVNIFLTWVQRELVEKPLAVNKVSLESWALVTTATGNLCIMAAHMVSPNLTVHSNYLLEVAFRRFEPGLRAVDSAAQLYYARSNVLDLTPPWNLNSNHEEAWQLGVVKTAVRRIKSGPVPETVKEEVEGHTICSEPKVQVKTIQSIVKTERPRAAETKCILIVSETRQAMVYLAGIWRPFRIPSGIPTGILAILNDRERRCWLAGHGGVACLPAQGNASNYEPKDNLPFSPISRVFQDSGGTIWISSYGDGIAFFDGLIWKKFRIQEGLCFDDVNGFAEDAQGRLWIGTDHGVSIYQNGQFIQNELVWQLEQLNIKSITNDRSGRVFFGYIGGLGIVHPDATVQYITTEHGLPQRTPQAVFVDHSSRIWAGTWGGGVARVDQVNFKIVTDSIFLQPECVGNICEDTVGNIYASSLTTGLWRLEINKSNWEHVDTPCGMDSLRLVANIPQSIAEKYQC